MEQLTRQEQLERAEELELRTQLRNEQAKLDDLNEQLNALDRALRPAQ